MTEADDQSRLPRILYVEDNRPSRRLVDALLRKHYEVVLAENALEGIDCARERVPDLVLMDIDLPDMDGRETTTRLRSLPGFGDTPVVALTANHSEGSRELALAAGCDGFLTKPLDPVRFPTQVAEFLDGRVERLEPEAQSEHLRRHAENVVDRLESKVRELETANERLRQLDRLKSDFIVLVSHELRSPLTLITGYADLLGASLDSQELLTDEALREIGEGLDSGVTKMRSVVNEIIRVSRVSSGNLKLDLEDVAILDLVTLLVDERAEVCVEREIQVAVEAQPDLVAVRADPEQLSEALGNVIENAIKFTPDGGWVKISAHRERAAVDLRIQDSGIGISVEAQKVIFDPFHVLGSIRHHSTSKTAFQGGGIGLGLAIAKGIVEAHNGRIWVESPGRDEVKPPGTTFHIELPASV